MYSNIILSLNIVYELHNWPCNPTNNFPLKNCLFGTVKLARNATNSKFTYNGWIIAFDGEFSLSFGNDFARNGVIFDVDNSSSFHTEIIKKIIFLVLGAQPTDGTNDNTGAAEKKKY